MAFNPSEARDAHGRWIKGWGELKKIVDQLHKDGKIDGAQHAAMLKAAQRHSEFGRGIPHDDTKDHAKTLEYLARTLRFDSVDARKRGDIKVSKYLSRTARAVENVHAAHTGKPRTGPMDALKPDGATEVKKVEKKAGEVKPTVKRRAKTKAEPKPKAEKKVGVKQTNQPKVVKKMASVKINAGNIKPGDEINMGNVKTYVGYGKGNVGHGMGYRKDTVKLHVSTVTRDEQGRISMTIDPERSQGLDTAVGYHNMGGAKNGVVINRDATTGEVTARVRSDRVVSVRRLTEQMKVGRKKTDLSTAPTLEEYHTALNQALQGGASVEELKQYDPSLRPLGRGQRVGHAQQLLYDMAVGKASGKIKTDQKVVTNAEYMQRLEQNGEARQIREGVDAATPYYLHKHERSLLVDKRVSTAMEARVAELRKAEGTASWDPGLPKWDDIHLETQDWATIEQRMQPHVVTESAQPTQADIQQALSGAGIHPQIAADMAVQHGSNLEELKAHVDRIHELSVPESQKVKAHIALDKVFAVAAKRTTQREVPADFVPTFYTAGMVEDGVLLHRRNPSTVDVERLTAALATDLTKHAGMEPTRARSVAANVMYGSGETVNMDLVRRQISRVSKEPFTAMGKPPTTEESARRAEVMNKTIEKVEAAVAKRHNEVTTSRVPKDANTAMTKIMESAGAVRVTNNSSPEGQGTWATLKPGEMLLHVEGGKKIDEKTAVTSAEFSNFPNLFDPNISLFAGKSPELQAATARWHNATTFAEREAALNQVQALWTNIKSQVAGMDQYTAYQKFGNSLDKKSVAQVDNRLSVMRRQLEQVRINSEHTPASGAPPIRRIEYVPWTQPSGGAPRNQRGRLTLVGYTPAEAAAKLRELGVVGNLEDQVPGNSIFRSTRRTGEILPLHSDFVRGIAEPTRSKNAITHGFTDRSATDAMTSVRAVTETGGLLSISERFKRGIYTQTSSKVGDIASGVDHVVFGALNSGGTCGSGSQVRVIMKPHVLLRRDVVIAATDYGGGHDRFSQYKRYRDEMAAQAGHEVGKTDLWSPLEPGARQKHLDEKNPHPGSSEYNVGRAVPVEDWEAVVVSSPALRDEMNMYFKRMKDEGIISEVPKVITKDQWAAVVQV